MDRELHIKDFIRNVLGCTCPDKVFERIEDREAPSSSSPHTRSITIGGRLLVYIWDVRSMTGFRDNLLALLVAGKKERDARGLNRFRAVLAVKETAQNAATIAESCFLRFAGSDDRMHLHVIPRYALENLH